ncbi:alpha/beta fold hydrolase [Sphingomonas sp. BK580]|uniref:alpha/beta fold hydrolase n=1 Tax=Sphingomonas sp. BK580 TaxID=2586972 RepID=UPI00161DF6AF|nr:alpha/beta hydrolase [Sphingomonas sp. BK580]MBB3693570.1 pimeloyl-ACP methyl ester carboxylesterase [Sphingomonas sp. BK580]
MFFRAIQWEVHVKRLIAGCLFLVATAATQAAGAQEPKPTIVLVHGAFADSSSWNGVISRLEDDGYRVIAAPDALRSVRGDARIVSSLVRSVSGPVVLVGHSYGGSVISEAASEQSNVKALVYVAAFAPDAGETALGLTGRFAGSTLAAALSAPVPLGSGVSDLYIDRDKFRAQFAADVPPETARLMAAGQRPIADAALKEPSGAPAWRRLPSWFVFGDQDRNIPVAAHRFMAKRAGAKATLQVEGGSHVVMVSHPGEVARLIEQAAAAR